MDANHGGGYSYRLCKIPPEGRSGLTEECFQQGHLAFAGPGRLSIAIFTKVDVIYIIWKLFSRRTPLLDQYNLSKWIVPCAESWIQYGYDETTRKYFTANRTTEGTYPPGSEWTKDPIANCAPYGGFYIHDPADLPCPDVRCKTRNFCLKLLVYLGTWEILNELDNHISGSNV